MMEEATKYIGYPYVWGGSSPSTSFDCSGYISWVLNHSGWNVGRQTAQGLYNFCTPVSAAQVKPGDLVFFKGTYDTPGVSIAYLCGQFHHAALRRPYLLHKPQLKILAGTFLQLWAFTVTPERILYGKKTSRIERDIERLKEKISEYQQQLKELEAAKTEQENLQIIQLVRSMNMKPDEFAAFLRSGALNAAPTVTPYHKQEDAADET